MPTLVLSFFRLIRLPNLIIVGLTQCLIYFPVLLPAFRLAGLQPLLDHFHFGLLVLDTILITAGGYIINDILDLPIDRINRKEKLIIGRVIAESTAYWLYFLFSLAGFGLAFYLAFYVKAPRLIWLYPLAVAGLFYYSFSLKRRLLTGNLLVAGYCAGVAGILWVAERENLSRLSGTDSLLWEETVGLIGWYLLFAFLSTLFREVVKDIEDVEGDVREQCDTVPIRWGIPAAKRLAALLAVLLLIALGVLSWQYRPRLTAWSFSFLLGGIGLPLLLALAGLQRARNREDFHRLSRLGKVIMLSGIFLLVLLSHKST